MMNVHIIQWQNVTTSTFIEHFPSNHPGNVNYKQTVCVELFSQIVKNLQPSFVPLL